MNNDMNNNSFRFNGNNRRNGRGGGGNNKPGKQSNLYQELNRTRIPRNLMRSTPFPPFVERRLELIEPNLLIRDSSNTFVIRDWRINSAYDPDPTLGGGSLTGFNQYAAMYNSYHVSKFRYQYTVASNEPGIPVAFGFIFRDLNRPSLTYSSYSLCLNALEEAPSTGLQMVGETSGQSVYRSPWYKISPGDVVGKRSSYEFDDDYDALVSTNPINPVWFSMIALSTTGSNLANGIIVALNMEFTVKFYGPALVSSSVRFANLPVPIVESRVDIMNPEKGKAATLLRSVNSKDFV